MIWVVIAFIGIVLRWLFVIVFLELRFVLLASLCCFGVWIRFGLGVGMLDCLGWGYYCWLGISFFVLFWIGLSFVFWGCFD